MVACAYTPYFHATVLKRLVTVLNQMYTHVRRVACHELALDASMYARQSLQGGGIFQSSTARALGNQNIRIPR